MATQPDDAGQLPVDDEQRPDDGTPNPETNDELPEGEGDPDPVESLASEMGWTPKDRYSGPAENWKDAATFIKEGRNIQRSTSRELSQLRGQLDTIAKTNAEILADRLAAQRAELTERYNQQVEDGDAQAAFKTSQRLIEVENRAKQPQERPPTPEGLEFAERNASWFGVDRAATVRAQAVCNDMASRGVSIPDQLKAAERIIRSEYPEHFTGQQNGQPNRPTPPGVSTPGSRAPASTNRTKGFADMPLEARKVAEGMVERGVIPDTKAYADKYWQTIGVK